jgi:hypothetical protein
MGDRTYYFETILEEKKHRDSEVVGRLVETFGLLSNFLMKTVCISRNRASKILNHSDRRP